MWLLVASILHLNLVVKSPLLNTLLTWPTSVYLDLDFRLLSDCMVLGLTLLRTWPLFFFIGRSLYYLLWISLSLCFLRYAYLPRCSPLFCLQAHTKQPHLSCIVPCNLSYILIWLYLCWFTFKSLVPRGTKEGGIWDCKIVKEATVSLFPAIWYLIAFLRIYKVLYELLKALL